MTQKIVYGEVMKKQTRYLWLQIVPVLFILCFGGVAQQKPEAAVKPELALEIDSGADRPWELPAFKGGGGETFVFKRKETS